MTPTAPRFIVCCDWSKEATGRAVFVADLPARTVRYVGPDPKHTQDGEPWSFEAALSLARSLRQEGPVLLTFDAPLGVPQSYLNAARQVPTWQGVRDFVEWLPRACATPGFFENGQDASTWTLTRPFVHVPGGDGSLRAIRDKAAEAGVTLDRELERRTRAKSVFIAAGIPGSVGSGTKDLWKCLARALEAGGEARDFGLWPFEGDLTSILEHRGIAIGEIYPRAAYGLALSRRRVEKRARLALSKKTLEDRTGAFTWLFSDAWLPPGALTGEALRHAVNDEDAFDAALTCVALLRCDVEGTPLSDPTLEDPIAEGGILGTGSMNLDLPELSFSGRHRSLVKDTPAPPGAFHGTYRPTPTPTRRSPSELPRSECPIPGCSYRFRSGRAGWDAHVGSLRKHPDWAPELTEPEARKRHFRDTYPDFFLD